MNRKNPCKPKSNEVILNKNKGDFECSVCTKHYSNKVSWYRHQKQCREDAAKEKSLKEERRFNELANELVSLRQELQEMKNAPPSTHNTTNNNTTNQTINVNFNNFGNENLEHITSDFLTHCIADCNIGFKNLLQKIHFDPEVPLNNNIRVKSSKQNMLEYYEDGVWVPCDKNNTLDTMINKGYRILYRHFLKTLDTDEDTFKESEGYLMDYFTKIAGKTDNIYFQLRRDLFVMIRRNEVLILGA